MGGLNHLENVKNRMPITFSLGDLKCAPRLYVVADLMRKRFVRAGRVWKDTPYASLSSSQKLDLYLPPEGDGPFPVVIWIHGGGWFSGDKVDFQLINQLRVLKRGYALVSVNHRLSDEAIFPAQIHDVKAAVRWIRANAKPYSLDPEKIAAWGASSGGHLAALLGTSGGVEELEDLSLGHPGESSRVQAVIDWYGPMDLLNMDEQLIQCGFYPWHNSPDTPETALIGGLATQFPDLVKKINPMTYISPESPPFLIEHGVKDKIVSMQQSVLLYERLASTIGPEKVILRLFLKAGHGDLPISPGILIYGPYSRRRNINIVLGFLDKYLK